MANEKSGEGEKGHGCSCMMCKELGMGCNIHWMHWMLRLAIILFVFWAGIKFDELKSLVENRFDGGSYLMQGGYGGAGYGGYQQPMMLQYRTTGAVQPAPLPQAAATSTRR